MIDESRKTKDITPSDCPFCNISGWTRLKCESSVFDTWIVICENCGANGPIKRTKADAVHAWNEVKDRKLGMVEVWEALGGEARKQTELNITTAYETLDPHDFGWAIRCLKSGLKVYRKGWNGKGMWLELQVPDEHSKMTLPYIYMKTAQDDLVPWLASQTDMLATDWATRDL